MPGVDDSLAKAPPEWLAKMFQEDDEKVKKNFNVAGTMTGRITSDTSNVKEVAPEDPLVTMNRALSLSCPFCKNKSLQRYDVEAGKVRCKTCDIIIGIGLVFSRQ